MWFKRHPNEIRPPPISRCEGCGTINPWLLVRGVISLPRNGTTRLASCRLGQRLHVQYHPWLLGGSQDDGPLPSCYAAFRGESLSLPLSSWRQLAKKRTELTMEKLPLSRRVIDVFPRDERRGKREIRMKNSISSRFDPRRWFLRFDTQYWDEWRR